MSFLKSKVFFLLEIALVIVTTIGLLQIVKKKKNIESEIAALEMQRDQAERENRELEHREQDISSDSYIELEAKRKLGYRKEGETVVVFYEEGMPESEGKSEVTAAPRESVSNPLQWLRYFFPL